MPRTPTTYHNLFSLTVEELQAIESGLAGVVDGYDEAIAIHHNARDEAGASKVYKKSLPARRLHVRVVGMLVDVDAKRTRGGR